MYFIKCSWLRLLEFGLFLVRFKKHVSSGTLEADHEDQGDQEDQDQTRIKQNVQGFLVTHLKGLVALFKYM